ncbi:hypothetical protein [Zavarzinella formosa]|uniref:hypothetical protein n=1 Tax=Zavarzinella formosa TaxID=360055 RepID=UPI0002F11D1C|nr:hypothetical protein [Zavarzinella formosa]
MNKLSVACVLALLWLILPQPSANAQFEQERASAKDELPRPDEVPTEEIAWKKFLEHLGKGPVCQVEILTRERPEGGLFYFRVLVSRACPFPIMRGFGIDRDDKCIPPPDPRHNQFQDLKRLVVQNRNPASPPLAFHNHSTGVWFQEPVTPGKELTLLTDCVGESGRLPEKPGQIEMVYHKALFRIEHLTAAQVEKAEPLRQNAAFFRDRVAAIQKEAIAAHRVKPITDERLLIQASQLFQDPVFNDELRAKLSKWIDRPTKELAHKDDDRFLAIIPNLLTYALARSGEPKDFELFHRLARRHPQLAGAIKHQTLILLDHAGGAQARDLASDLMKNPAPADSHHLPEYELLRKLDPDIPEHTEGDRFLLMMTHLFKLKPADFGLRMAESRWLELADRREFSPGELQDMREKVKNESGPWMMMRESDRKSGQEAALKWIAGRKP